MNNEEYMILETDEIDSIQFLFYNQKQPEGQKLTKESQNILSDGWTDLTRKLVFMPYKGSP